MRDGHMTLKVKVNDPSMPCQSSQENLKMHIWWKFDYSSSNPFQVIVRTSQISWNSQPKWPKWPRSSRSMTPIFHTRQEYTMMHIRCNLGILVTSYFRGQAEFPRILSQNGQHDLKNQGQWPLFSIPAKSIPGCMFCANLVVLAQICEDLLSRQIKFPKILSQKSQNDLKAHFQYQTRVSQYACLVQIWWFNPKSVTSYCTVKPNFLEF